ncbi:MULTISPECIES: glycosyltransferase family 4 protein [unclassified Streptomyces]|uniref:glycosyltransferase family 4 protein n=1 Tax=unclassified Streptomyces TaxID=2593676 RepID=UPI002024B5C0|nr:MULTISPECIES: glycosyltransferase family 4 protein [unclassified Streptomyces]MCX4550604.1 glycosyltransferase family 4 protein [Streptomyces sp. NBC_01500]WSC22049.1 glycosyltransferase family 4 protein [Streptomyces sp. NBC_01766]
MRILVILPVYGQASPTGAFVTTREYVRHLSSAGHAVDVVTTIREPGDVRLEGRVRVWPLRYWRRAVQAAVPELVISHHGDRKARRITAQVGLAPNLLMVHGMAADADLGKPALVWFPSQACREHYPAYRGRALVLPPPINPLLYQVDGEASGRRMVTLNGSTRAKGADVLADLAARMPEARFLMVRAAGHAADHQALNVSVVDRADPRDVYARTRILLMPSTTESYGRAGVEAMVSGIPVLASPLPGMREAFGDAATYIPREDTARWVSEIRRLSDPATYATASARATAHTGALDYPGNLAAFEAACLRLRPRTSIALARRARRPPKTTARRHPSPSTPNTAP